MSQVVKHKLFFAWNMEKEKAFLEEQARQGNHLVKVKLGTYVFEQGEPKDMVYQFDFQMLHKNEELDYLDLFEDWELVQRFSGWYYFRKERDGTNDEIYSNVESVKQLFQRLIIFLIIVGVPLYYQTLVLFPNRLVEDEVTSFYMWFAPLAYILTGLHFYSVVRLLLKRRSLDKDIRE